MSPKRVRTTLFRIFEARRSHLYLNRRSRIDFNSKVLEEAMDPSTPMLEQLKFCHLLQQPDGFWCASPTPAGQYRSGVSLSPDNCRPEAARPSGNACC